MESLSSFVKWKWIKSKESGNASKAQNHVKRKNEGKEINKQRLSHFRVPGIAEQVIIRKIAFQK